MAKVNLSLNENKTKADLTLEVRGTSQTWDTVGGTWDDHTSSTWDRQRSQLALESKTKDDLTSETK